MPQVRSVASNVTIPKFTRATLSAADVKTARGLKSAIADQLKTVRLAQRRDNLPKYDSKSDLWRSPDGHPLVTVQLTKAPPQTRDFPSTEALVDPKTNTYFYMSVGGIAGPMGAGPLSLPARVAFKNQPYSVTDCKALTAAAAGKVSVEPPKKVFHFKPQVFSVGWNYGSGIALPPNRENPRPRVGSSIDVNLVFPYIDIKPRWKVSTNEATKTITVLMDGESTNTVHPRAAVHPYDVTIPMQRPKFLGATYTLLVKDTGGKTLAKSTFRNMLPM